MPVQQRKTLLLALEADGEPDESDASQGRTTSKKHPSRPYHRSYYLSLSIATFLLGITYFLTWDALRDTEYYRYHPATSRRAVLHIGPHKSATTSIQCTLHRLFDDLKLDSWIFLGKVDAKFCGLDRAFHKEDYDRVRKMETCVNETDCWVSLTKSWKKYSDDSTNLILSREYLSDLASPNHSDATLRSFFWSRLAQALEGFEVTVLMTYRRYHEWLPSAFYQHAYHTRLQKREPWPSDVSYRYPWTFEDLLVATLRQSTPPPYPYLDELLKFPFPPGWKIQILNLHQEGDIVQHLICGVLSAQTTCSKWIPVLHARTSPAEDLVFDYINARAIEFGWLKPGKRGAQMRATKSLLQKRGVDVVNFPRHCPDKESLDCLLSRSIKLEQQILGRVDRMEQFRQQFWSSTEAMCAVNTTELLLRMKDSWRAAFESMNA